MSLDDRDYMRERYRSGGRAKGRPVWMDLDNRMASDDAEPAGRDHQRAGSSRAPRPAATSPFRRIFVGFLVAAGLIAVVMALKPANDAAPSQDFPASGEFRVKQAQSSGDTGSLTLTAGAINAILTLHGPTAEPVFIGFVRAGEQAVFPVPVGIWRVIIRETPGWDGTTDPGGITADGPEVESLTVHAGSSANITLGSATMPLAPDYYQPWKGEKR